MLCLCGVVCLCVCVCAFVCVCSCVFVHVCNFCANNSASAHLSSCGGVTARGAFVWVCVGANVWEVMCDKPNNFEDLFELPTPKMKTHMTLP